MTKWSPGFATRAAAERASKWGSFACFFQAVRETLGNIFVVSSAGKPIDDAIAWFIGQSLLPVLLVIAGIRLWQNKGWVWGSLAALAVMLELIGAVVSTYPQT